MQPIFLFITTSKNLSFTFEDFHDNVAKGAYLSDLSRYPPEAINELAQDTLSIMDNANISVTEINDVMGQVSTLAEELRNS